MNLYAVCPVVLFSVILLFMLAKRQFVTLDCDELLEQLHPLQMEGRMHLITDEEPQEAGAFEETGGMRGAWFRWRNRVILLRLCQIRTDVPESELRDLKNRIAEMTRASLVLIMVYPLYRLAPSQLDLAAAKAFRIYVEIAGEAYACLLYDHEPLCARKLATLL